MHGIGRTKRMFEDDLLCSRIDRISEINDMILSAKMAIDGPPHSGSRTSVKLTLMELSTNRGRDLNRRETNQLKIVPMLRQTYCPDDIGFCLPRIVSPHES